MSLRMRWFLVIGGLVALLVVAQGWWVRQLAVDLDREEERVAVNVGQSMAQFFFTEDIGAAQVFTLDSRGGRLEELAKEASEAPSAEAVIPEALWSESGQGEPRVHVFDFVVPSPSAGDADSRRVPSAARTSKTMISCEGEVCRERRIVDGRVEERVLSAEEVQVQRFERTGHGIRFGSRLEHVGAHHDDSHHDDSHHDVASVDLDTEISLHLQDEGDRRFLLLAGPNVEHRVAIPQSGIEARLDTFTRHVLLGSLGILGVGLILAALLAHRVTRPLQMLSASARRVGEGDWGDQVAMQGSGEVAQAIAAFNHMSRRLAELDASNQELAAQQHLSEIGEIARGLAHSLRNPLNALGLSVDELATRGAADAAEPTDVDELARSARKQIRRIDQSIRSFLALASQGGGVVAPVDLGQLADDVALEALQDARGRVRVEVERGPEDELTLDGVEPELRAVLQALVVNAIEASPDAGQVTVRLQRRGEMLHVQVDDEGPGLPPEVRERLFTPHLSTKANGSGMGLFLAHRIACNRYGGRLELEPRRPCGTRVELRLRSRVESGTLEEVADHGA